MKNKNFIHSTDTEYPKSRNNRLLGIFYFLWLGTTGWTGKPINISELTAEHPDAGYQTEQVCRLRGIGDETVLNRGENTVFFDYPDGNFNRNAPGYGVIYTNGSGRNTIREITLANDGDSVKFTLCSGNDFDSDRSGTFMQLFIKSGGHDYHISADGAISELSCIDGKLVQSVYSGIGKAECTVNKSSVEYVIPKSAIGLQDGGALDFKAADSREEIASEEDFYDHGDVIPLGYAYYRAVIK